MPTFTSLLINTRIATPDVGLVSDLLWDIYGMLHHAPKLTDIRMYPLLRAPPR